MRVIDNKTDLEYEVGLFEDVVWGHALKIRLLQLPLVFGEMGEDAGFLESWKSDEADADDGIIYSLDENAWLFFALLDPFEDILSPPQAVLESIIHASPRFRAAQ